MNELIFKLSKLEFIKIITKNDFDEFMKDHKPLVHRIIPRNIAIEWLEQAMKSYRKLFPSEEKYLEMCKENNW